MRLSDIICEVAIAPEQSVRWDRRTEKLWTGSFLIGERHIEIFFVRCSASRWRVDFRKGKHQPNRGTVAETTGILNAVMGAIKEFLESVKPDQLDMSPTNKSREKLYRTVIKRMMPQIRSTYDVDEKSYGSLFGEFIFSRRNTITEGRRLQTDYGRFLLNPSKAEFEGYFRGCSGAAFYLDQAGDVALGAGAGTSIDHSTISQAFGLGAEAARGFITLDGRGQIEVWAQDAESVDTLSPLATAKIDRIIQAVKTHPSLARLAKLWRLIVFNADYVEIVDRLLSPQIAEADDRH